MAMSAWSFHSWKMPSDAWRPTRLLYTSVKWCWKDIFLCTGREGFKWLNFGKAPEIYVCSIPHSNQKVVVKRNFKRGWESSRRINGHRVYFKNESPVVVGLYSKDSRWGKNDRSAVLPCGVRLSWGSWCKERSFSVCDLRELPRTGILGQYFYPDLGWRPLMAAPVALRSCLHVLLSQQGHWGGESRGLFVSVALIVVLCKLEFSCSGSWLHIVKAGESESVLTLCLKHLDVFSLSPRSLIWVFN